MSLKHPPERFFLAALVALWARCANRMTDVTDIVNY